MYLKLRHLKNPCVYFCFTRLRFVETVVEWCLKMFSNRQCLQEFQASCFKMEIFLGSSGWERKEGRETTIFTLKETHTAPALCLEFVLSCINLDTNFIWFSQIKVSRSAFLLLHHTIRNS